MGAQFFVHVGFPFRIEHLFENQAPVPCRYYFQNAQSAECLARQSSAPDGEAAARPDSRKERVGFGVSDFGMIIE